MQPRKTDEVLTNKIGDYGVRNGVEIQGTPLASGIAEYEASHTVKVIDFVTKHGLALKGDDLRNPKYFRENFVRFIEELNASEDKIRAEDPESRSKNPKEAAIKMEDLFGKKGTELYQLALEEEINSDEYMAAVYHHSTETFEGEKWAERPIVPVSGPSASGKTTAAKKALEEASMFLKKTGEMGTNTVVTVDGGTARKTSQMRKLAIIAANNKGYTGIADLQSKSKMLNDVKQRIYRYALDNTDHGVVIPETFSHFINPFDDTRKMMKEICNLPNSKTIFVRVKGKDKSIFKKVVAFMGSARAWKIDGFDKPQALSLNADTIESKAYGAGGFRWGVIGSRLAEQWYKQNSKENLRMIITNDLILKKEDPKDSNKWVDAAANDKGATLVTERVFKKWQEYIKNGEKNGIPQDKLKSLLDFKKEFADKPESQPLIKTSAAIKLMKATKKIAEMAASPDARLKTTLTNISQKLNELNDIKSDDFRTKIEKIEALLHLVSDSTARMNRKDYPTEYKELKKLQNILQLQRKELISIQDNKETKQLTGQQPSQSETAASSKDPGMRSKEPAPLPSSSTSSLSSTTAFVHKMFAKIPNKVRTLTKRAVPDEKQPQPEITKQKQPTLVASDIKPQPEVAEPQPKPVSSFKSRF